MPIPGLRGLSLRRLFKYAYQRFFSNEMPIYSAAVTLHMFFSLFPFLIFFIALLGFLDLSFVFDWVRKQFQQVFLQQTVVQMNQILDQFQQRRLGLLSFGVTTSVLAASYGMLSVMKALNVVYGVREGRPLWKRYALSMVYTVIVGSMIAAAITLVLVTPQAMQTLGLRVGMASNLAVLWAWWLRWPVVVLLLTAAMAVMYGVAPDVEQRFRFVTPGAFLSVVLWLVTSAGFNFYVQNVGNYNALYGSVGTIIVLLLYAYISTGIVLYGAEVNAVIEHHAPTGKDSGEKSAGPDQSHR